MNTIDPQLLHKYFHGYCSAEEAGKVLDWFGTPEGEKYLEQQLEKDFTHVSQGTALVQESTNADEILDRIREKMIESPSVPVRKKIWWSNRWVGAAAASVTLLLACLSYWLLIFNEQKVSYHTDFGQTKEIILPDQSKVILNGNTTLTYQKDWDDEHAREVYLDGEAFFSVVHTHNHQQFVVNTPSSLKVEVLGTQFNVFQRQQKTKVSLNEGKVKLHIEELPEEGNVTMQPGELVEFDSQSQKVWTKKVNPEVYSSWKSNRLIFDQTSLLEISQLLRDTYGLTVEISDSTLLTQKFSGTVPNQNVEILLEGLSGLFDLQITREGKYVYFKAQ